MIIAENEPLSHGRKDWVVRHPDGSITFWLVDPATREAKMTGVSPAPMTQPFQF